MTHTWDLFPKKIKLNDLRVVAYVDFLNKFVAINVDPKKVKINQLCYFQVTKKHIFPKEFYKKWLCVRLYRVFPSSSSDMGNPWVPKSGGEVTEYTADYWFYVLDVKETEEEIKSDSKLHGFRHVIDDNEYFSAIPKINEIGHWDNGIISNSKVSVEFLIDEDPNKWDKFKIIHSTETDKTFSIIKMATRHHENPER